MPAVILVCHRRAELPVLHVLLDPRKAIVKNLEQFLLYRRFYLFVIIVPFSRLLPRPFGEVALFRRHDILARLIRAPFHLLVTKGLKHDRDPVRRPTGLCRIAVGSAVVDAPDPAAAARRLLTAIETAKTAEDGDT